MNFNKNDLIDSVLIRYYDTFRLTLDTADFVPDKYNDKILAYIFKNMKKAFKLIDKDDRLYQRARKKLEAMLRAAASEPENAPAEPSAPPDQTERDGTSDQTAPQTCGTP